MNIVVDCSAGTINDPLLRNPYFVRKRVGRTGPDYDSKKSDAVNRILDEEFLRETATHYGVPDLAETLINCKTLGAWRDLTWR